MLDKVCKFECTFHTSEFAQVFTQLNTCEHLHIVCIMK